MLKEKKEAVSYRFKERVEEVNKYGYTILLDGTVVRLRLSLRRGFCISYVETPILIELQKPILVIPGLIIMDSEHMSNYTLVSEELMEAQRQRRYYSNGNNSERRFPDKFELEEKRISRNLAQDFLRENGMQVHYETFEIVDVSMDIQE